MVIWLAICYRIVSFFFIALFLCSECPTGFAKNEMSTVCEDINECEGSDVTCNIETQVCTHSSSQTHRIVIDWKYSYCRNVPWPASRMNNLKNKNTSRYATTHQAAINASTWSPTLAKLATGKMWKPNNVKVKLHVNFKFYFKIFDSFEFQLIRNKQNKKTHTQIGTKWYPSICGTEFD